MSRRWRSRSCCWNRYGLANWLLPAIEGALLLLVLVGEPSELTRRSRWLRPLSIALVSVLVFSSLWSAAFLIAHLIHGGRETNSADALLRAGSIVWASNNLAFALLYWELDSGGVVARARRERRRPDLAFPQQLNPELGWAEWEPRFVDYIYRRHERDGVQPHGRHAPRSVGKDQHGFQSLISLAILGLVIARAVNVFT